MGYVVQLAGKSAELMAVKMAAMWVVCLVAPRVEQREYWNSLSSSLSLSLSLSILSSAFPLSLCLSLLSCRSRNNVI